MPEPVRGGCVCGRYRYTIHEDAATMAARHCHCQLCRRASGATHLTCLEVPTVSYHVDDNEDAAPLQSYATSKHAKRAFCPTCGSTVTFEYLEKPEFIYISVGTLDHPEHVRPNGHIFVQGGILPLDLNLPQYEQGIDGPRAN
ncbi:Mss4-like protein [Gongronella butleri]|nr:Mss4-like protein [Gongronella butleri]